VRRINFKFLLILIVLVCVVAGAAFLVRRFQVSRNAGSKLEMARERLEEGKIADALFLFGQYVSLRPNDNAAFAEYSKLLLARATAPDATRNDVARAFNTLETAVRRNPDDDDLRQQLAEFQLRVGRATDAREHLTVLERRLAEPPEEQASTETLAEREAMNRRVRLLKASSYLGSGEFEEAARIVASDVGYDLASRQFTEAAEQATADTEAYVVLAVILQERLDAPADARRVLEELVAKKGDEPRAWLALSTWHRERGQTDQAAAAVAKALELAPDDPNCVFAQFELALASRDLAKALAVAERAKQLFPDEERVYRGLAAVFLQQQDLPAAESILLEGVERLPGKPSLQMMLTDVLLQQNKLEEAAQAINRIRELYGSTSGPVGLLEARLLVAERRWSDAKTKLEQIRPLVMGNPDLIRQVDLYLGQCHAQLDEYDAQLEVNRRILIDDPGSLAARAGAAQALISAGKTDQALAEFEALAAALEEDKLVAIPQVWYPLLQLRISSQSERPREERDWTGVDGLIEALGKAGSVSPTQLAMLRAESLIRRGETDAARELIESVATDEADGQVWAALVTLVLRVDGPEEARQTLQRVPAAVANDPAMLVIEAQVAARSPAAEALPILDDIAERAGRLEPAAAARVLAGIAPIRLAAGDREGAKRLWTSAAEKQPEDLGIQEALLELAVANRDLEEARGVAAQIGEIAGRTSARTKVAEASIKLLEARLELAELERNEAGALRELPERITNLLAEARNLLTEAENDRPGWSQVQILFADVYLLQGNRSAAIDRLRRAINVGPSNPAVVRRLVALLYAANRLEEAQQAMAQLGEEGTEGLERISAEVELRAGKLEEAVALAEQSVAGDTQNHEDLLWLGQLLARSGKTERAGEVLERATELAPEDPEVWLALFTHRIAAGSPATAERALDEAAKLMPEPRRQLALAQGYEMLGRPDDAERVLREGVAGWPDDLEAMRGLASFQIRKGRRKDARDLLDKILAAPDDAVARATKPWARRAIAEMEGGQGTFRQLEDALKLLKENRSEDGEVSADDLNLEIALLTNRPEPTSWRRAIKLLDQLAEQQPLTTAERLQRAELKEKVGDWDAARNELVALVASPKTPPAYVALLIEKLIKHNETSTAGTWLRRLERATPDSAITIALQAKLAMAENDRKKAADFARQLMPSGDPATDNPAQLNAVGKLMEDLGFPKAADRVFERFAGLSMAGAVARIEFLSRQGRSVEALDLLEARWDEFSLERALSLAIQVLRSQTDETQAVEAAGRIGPWIEKGKRIDPGSIVISLLDAEIRTLLDRPGEAEGIYRDLLASPRLSASQRAIVSNNLAFHLAKPASAEEARKLIDSAIEELGPLPDLLDTRGLVRLAAGDVEAAVEDLREAVLDPSPAKHLHLAFAEWTAGDKTAAREALEIARQTGLGRMRLMPEDAERLEALEREFGPPATAASAS
jgi:tetratricopeptide (TPR) repeat protein